LEVVHWKEHRRPGEQNADLAQWGHVLGRVGRDPLGGLCPDGDRRGEEAARHAADERPPLHHPIT
jgi:hypothetical protein